MTKSSESSKIIRNLLWVDCVGAALAGVLVLSFSSRLGVMEGLPHEVLLFSGAANLGYGSYSCALARRKKCPMHLLKVLVVANLMWPLVCIGILFQYHQLITPFAWIHLAGEALYVGGLAIVEWRYRKALTT